MLPAERCGLGELERALGTLARVEPRAKKALLGACAAAVAADRSVEAAEAALFRAVADALDCPVPPLLPGQRLA